MNNIIQKINLALEILNQLLEKYPKRWAYNSCKEQLIYLLNIINNNKKLDKNLTIGLITVREIENVNDDLAKILFEISDFIDYNLK